MRLGTYSCQIKKNQKHLIYIRKHLLKKDTVIDMK